MVCSTARLAEPDTIRRQAMSVSGIVSAAGDPDLRSVCFLLKVARPLRDFGRCIRGRSGTDKKRTKMSQTVAVLELSMLRPHWSPGYRPPIRESRQPRKSSSASFERSSAEELQTTPTVTPKSDPSLGGGQLHNTNPRKLPSRCAAAAVPYCVRLPVSTGVERRGRRRERPPVLDSPQVPLDMVSSGRMNDSQQHLVIGHHDYVEDALVAWPLCTPVQSSDDSAHNR